MSSYSQLREACSQAVYDEESQSYCIESQSDEAGTVKLGFQAEFLKHHGMDQIDISKYTNITKPIQEQNNPHDLNSQTDAEFFIPVHMFDNPNWHGSVDPRQVRIAQPLF